MSYKCPRCSTQIKDWEGDDPKCGFDENGNFLERNWCCATLTALREMAEPNEVWCDDHYMSIISRVDVGHGVLSWYKHRGQTDDFRDRNLERGTLYYAQQLLGDVEPACYSGWENVNLDDNDD